MLLLNNDFLTVADVDAFCPYIAKCLQSLVLNKCLILVEEAEPEYQKAVVQHISHLLTVLLGKDGQ